ncbi:MAG: PilZ domain-containing protein [Bdellovibrionales bacterium]
MKKFKIMVVDDRPLTVERYKSANSDTQSTAFFCDVKTALSCYPLGHYDLVITDLKSAYKENEAFLFDILDLRPTQRVAVISEPDQTLNFPPSKGVLMFQRPSTILNVIDQVLFGKKPLTDEDQILGSRRRYPRYPVKIDSKLIKSDQALDIIICNLSLGGAYIEAPFNFSLEDAFTLELPLPDKTLTVTVVKRWENPGPTIQPDTIGIGVEFLNLEPAEHEEVEQYLKTLTPPN